MRKVLAISFGINAIDAFQLEPWSRTVEVDPFYSSLQSFNLRSPQGKQWKPTAEPFANEKVKRSVNAEMVFLFLQNVFDRPQSFHLHRPCHSFSWFCTATVICIQQNGWKLHRFISLRQSRQKKLCLSSAWVCKNENIHRVNFQLNILNRKSNVTNVLVHVQCPAYTFLFLSFIQIDSKLCVAQVNFVQKSFKFQSTSRYKQIIERTIALHVNWTFLKWATKMKFCQCAAEKKKCTNRKKELKDVLV